jgi:hypothetical protein
MAECRFGINCGDTWEEFQGFCSMKGRENAKPEKEYPSSEALISNL